MWLLEYPDQKVVTPDGIEVTVVRGKDFWSTYEAASAQLERLRKWWPGLRADIRPAAVPAPRKKKAVGAGI